MKELREEIGIKNASHEEYKKDINDKIETVHSQLFNKLKTQTERLEKEYTAALDVALENKKFVENLREDLVESLDSKFKTCD